MSVLPYQRIQINTRLSGQEACKRLENVVQPERAWGVFQKGEKPYEGKVEGTRFEFSPTITYRNPGKPIIKGNIQDEVNGCSIYASMQLSVFSILFIMMFICIVGLFALVLSFVSSTDTSFINSPIFLFIGVCVFIYLMVLGGFTFEADKSKEFFRKLFESDEIKDLGFTNPAKAAG